MKKLDVQDVGELRKIVGTDTLSVEEVLADFNAVTETGFVSMGDFMEIIFGYIINAHGYERLQDKNTQEIVEHLFNLFDEDGNGVVDYQELASGLATLCGSSTSAEKVRAIFNVYDKNGDGYISMQEMTEYLTATFKVMLQTKPMAKVGPRQLAAMIAHEAFQQCDANKDGKLNFAEFTMWFDENGGDAVSSLNENGASPAGPRHDFEAMAQKIVFQREVGWRTKIENFYTYPVCIKSMLTQDQLILATGQYTEKAEKNELASRRAKLETARRKRVELAEKLERMHAGAKSIHEVDFELHKSHMKGDGTLPNVDTSMPTPSPASFAQSNSNKEKRYGKVEQTVRRVYVSPGKPQRSFRHMTDMENEFGKVIDKLNSVDEDLHATSEVLHERNIKIDAINSELRTLKAYHATLLTIMRDLAGKVGGKNKRIVRRFSTISTAEMMSTSTEIPDPKNFEDESFARQYIDKKIDVSSFISTHKMVHGGRGSGDRIICVGKSASAGRRECRLQD